MKTLSLAAVLLAVSATFAQSCAQAAERLPYSPAAFAAAQKAGKSILIDISAPWCPTCRAQAPILGALEAEAKFKALVVFDVDFDSEKPVVRSFGANAQSTLIAFKGATETARSLGDSDPARIAALLDTTL